MNSQETNLSAMAQLLNNNPTSKKQKSDFINYRCYAMVPSPTGTGTYEKCVIRASHTKNDQAWFEAWIAIQIKIGAFTKYELATDEAKGSATDATGINNLLSKFDAIEGL